MIEVIITLTDWIQDTGAKDDTKRLEEIMKLLRENKWKEFGNDGEVLFFKDVDFIDAQDELIKLGITELEPREWIINE